MPVSTVLSGLRPNVTYHFRLVASSQLGTAYEPDMSFTTTGAELGHCEELLGKPSGRFKTNSCTGATTTTGRYEWHPGLGPRTGVTVSAASTTLETRGRTSIRCAGYSLSGELTGPETLSGTVRFTGCAATGAIVGECRTPSADPGEIETTTLIGRLGIVKDAKSPAVGLAVEPTSGTEVAAPECGDAAVDIFGGVIAALTPSDKEATSVGMKFKATIDRQIPPNFEGQPFETLTLATPGREERAGLSSSGSLETDEPIEIRAKD